MSKINISFQVQDKETVLSEYVLITNAVAVPRIGDGFLFPENTTDTPLGVFTVSNVVWCFDSPDGQLCAEVSLAPSLPPEIIAEIKSANGIQ